MDESFLVRLPTGDDLLEAITRAFRERSVRKATFTVIGATSRAVLGYYDQDAKEYRMKPFDLPQEIVAYMGNVSEKDGEIFVHAHIVLAGEDYTCVGGHLMLGTVIFAAELAATPVPGPVPVRLFDETTKLALWSQSSEESGR